jgi:hypothetical protein
MLGLLNYGFDDDAAELKLLWCDASLKENESHGTV